MLYEIAYTLTSLCVVSKVVGIGSVIVEVNSVTVVVSVTVGVVTFVLDETVVVFFFFFVVSVSVKVKVVTGEKELGKKEEVDGMGIEECDGMGIEVGGKEEVGKLMSKVVRVEVGKLVGKVILVVMLLMFIIYQAKSLVFIIQKK